MEEKLDFWTDNLIEASFEEPQLPDKSGWKTELVRLFSKRPNRVVVGVAVMISLCFLSANAVWADDFTWVKYAWNLTASILILAVGFVTTKPGNDEDST